MNWEPWTGCYQISAGCDNCYYYGPNAKRYLQNKIEKTDKFDWPIRVNKKGEYNIKGNKILATCFATDFFLPEADEWRKEVWKMIKQRSDIDFLILTKRIDRFLVSLPDDWNDGYDNVNIGCSIEDQATADYRLPLFLSFPIKRRFIACAPLLEKIDLSKYLHAIDHVSVGGETSREARVCDYAWVLDIRKQCLAADITFWFKNTGSLFKYEGNIEKVNPFKQTTRAKELDISILKGKKLF
ncbi:phage Gp37/Gp68 family protein [Erysipelotrichaceae bacterium OttesenSCG-928-M19]|nr:phage Gp37/Gp68 family protein [Erysipelotrichaceae bacterium OttesenSCG-928-M19]